MNSQTKPKPAAVLAEPIKIITPEAWQWEVLATAFYGDQVMKFWLGNEASKDQYLAFFEAVVKDTLDSGGAVFASPDKQVVLVWTALRYTLEEPGPWKRKWYEVLGPEGLKRYNSLYEAGDLGIKPEHLKNSMLPDYMGVMPETQGLGYGSHILKWTFDYYQKQNYEIPFLIASTRRSAKLYGPLINLYIHKEVFLTDVEEDGVAVFMKHNSLRNESLLQNIDSLN